MSNRTQKTTVNGHTSSSAHVTYGTAQGSILGPLIFILYVNDVFKSLETDVSTYMYADDTLLICKSNNAVDATEKAQKALDGILYWCEENKLTINRENTKFMLVRHTKTLCNPQIKIGNDILGTRSRHSDLKGGRMIVLQNTNLPLSTDFFL